MYKRHFLILSVDRKSCFITTCLQYSI